MCFGQFSIEISIGVFTVKFKHPTKKRVNNSLKAYILMHILRFY
jgi:hypothetical protein